MRAVGAGQEWATGQALLGGALKGTQMAEMQRTQTHWFESGPQLRARRICSLDFCLWRRVQIQRDKMLHAYAGDISPGGDGDQRESSLCVHPALF